MEKNQRKVIVLNVKKHHGGHHGGSWKVAYADFVTAMMAFFLLMWLLNMTPPEKKAVLSLYFSDYNMFKEGGKSFSMEGGNLPIDGKDQQSSQLVQDADDEKGKDGITPEQMKGLLLTALDKNFQHIKDQVIVESRKNGIRVQMIDKDGSAMFASGSAQLTNQGKMVINVIAQVTKGFPARIALEGHTDSSFVKGEQASNWELSLARACTARRELEADGIKAGRIAQVVGYANTVPLMENNRSDPRNRRISIMYLLDRVAKSAGKKGSIDDLLEPKY